VAEEDTATAQPSKKVANGAQKAKRINNNAGQKRVGQRKKSQDKQKRRLRPEIVGDNTMESEMESLLA